MKKNGAEAAIGIVPYLQTWPIPIDDTSDAQLDALLPRVMRRVSSVYWTPVRVARRAAQIFDDLGVSRVLDVGSGPGKFCIVAGARVRNSAHVARQRTSSFGDFVQRSSAALSPRVVDRPIARIPSPMVWGVCAVNVALAR